ncbi:cysteine desulfurase [Desulfogranum mediterraneum]|uniref:cysteine desulfurase n=1 Tax=Desulfogranum mediterraneum TaxID=160661 RepID=UPI0003F80004|nr:cysteine desulfurase [Desulfogranum mediterraneum]
MKEAELNRIRADFPNLGCQVHGHPLAYLDNAATTMKPRQVIEAITNHYRAETANVHRGLHHLSVLATKKYEGAREKVVRFINAGSEQEIIFTRGTTEAINLAASSYGGHLLKPGDEILVSQMEHHSNIVPWQLVCQSRGLRLKVIPMDESGQLRLDRFRELLTERVRLVALVYTSNALGTINPVEQIIEEAHGMGAVVLLDAAQTIAHLEVDVQELDCDFLAFSGHKMFGPTGIGVLYGKENLLEQMPPYQGGGEMISQVTFAKTTYNALPYKFEAGTPPIAQAIGLGAAIDYIESIGFAQISEHEELLRVHASAQLARIPGLRIIGTAARKAAICAFSLEEIHPHDLGTFLDQRGIAVRTGHHCAQPVLDFFGLPATTRASFSVYNSLQEVDLLAAAIEEARSFFL